MNESFNIAVSNLTSVSVLVFALGFLAARFKSDIRIPDQVYQIISVYLLFGIGLKGGVSLYHSGANGLLKPITATIVLGILIPVIAFYILKRFRRLSEVDQGALAAHYGSTSLVTFTAALVYLDNLVVPYEGFVTALLTIMEIPGIVVGIFLASRHLNRSISWRESLQEILLGKTVFLLVGGLIVGLIAGDAGYERVVPFFVDLLPGILALFLMHLGFLAGSRLSALREVGGGLIVFAIAFPLVAGSLGVVGGVLADMSAGGATVLGVLCASASYIAAPAAVSIAIPEANPALTITSSLAITFPFNLIVGIPTIYAIAQALSN